MAILKKSKNFDELKKKVAKQSQSNSFFNKDEIKWEPGNTYILRLLFREEDEDSKWKWDKDLPTSDGFIKRKTHATKDVNGKYMEVTCPTTFFPKDGYSMCDTCGDLGDMYKEQNPMYKKLKRKDGIYAHVYVVKDPVTPSNNGHVKIMWMGRGLYTNLKLQIWGIDERWKKDGEELEEVDQNSIYGEEAFMLDDGFNLQVKVSKKVVKNDDGSSNEYNEYTANFAKDRTSLDVDIDQLEVEIEDLKLGKDFIQETPERLREFYERCVLGNTGNTGNTEGTESSSVEKKEAPKSPSKSSVKAKKEKVVAEKKKKKEDSTDDQIDMGESIEEDGDVTGDIDIDDINDIDDEIMDIMKDMDLE